MALIAPFPRGYTGSLRDIYAGRSLADAIATLDVWLPQVRSNMERLLASKKDAVKHDRQLEFELCTQRFRELGNTTQKTISWRHEFFDLFADAEKCLVLLHGALGWDPANHIARQMPHGQHQTHYDIFRMFCRNGNPVMAEARPEHNNACLNWGQAKDFRRGSKYKYCEQREKKIYPEHLDAVDGLYAEDMWRPIMATLERALYIARTEPMDMSDTDD